MITDTYRDITITLLEDENKWRFIANGRERTAPTLPKAREYIDNALDAVREKKEKPWQPFDAWSNGGYGGWRKVRVTSIAERNYSGKSELWTNDPNAKDYRGNAKPERKKVSEIYLRADTPHNAEAVQRIDTLRKLVEQTQEEIREIERGMDAFVVPSNTDPALSTERG